MDEMWVGVFARIQEFFSGGSRPDVQKTVWAAFFLVLSQFYSLQRMSNGFLQRKLYFSKDPERGPTFFRGFNFFPGGFQMLISIETHITCDFPGGSGPPTPPPPPSGSALSMCGWEGGRKVDGGMDGWMDG